MTSFLVLATVISVIVVGLLVWASLKQQGRSQITEARAQCYGVHEQTLRELDADRSAGLVTEEAYREARFEAESRLVEDIRNIDERPLVQPVYRWLVPLIFAVPLAAAGLYLLVGNLDANNPEAAFIRTGNVAQFVDAVAALEEKVKRNPEDLQSQLMLARSYRAMGRYEDSVAAFGKAWPLIKEDPTEIAIFAGALAVYRGSFEGKPDELIRLALTQDNKNQDALMLAGGSAFQKDDYVDALRHWQRLDALLENGSEEKQWLATQIAEARERMANPDARRDSAAPPAIPEGAHPGGSMMGTRPPGHPQVF